MSILLKLQCIVGQKSQTDALFLRFYTKKLLSCAFLSKKHTFSKENSVLMPIFCQKNVHSLKNTVLSCQIFHEIPPAAMPIFGKKTSILSKLHHIIGKKVKGCPFFPTFHLKITAHMLIFCQKNVNSLKK